MISMSKPWHFPTTCMFTTRAIACSKNMLFTREMAKACAWVQVWLNILGKVVQKWTLLQTSFPYQQWCHHQHEEPEVLGVAPARAAKTSTDSLTAKNAGTAWTGNGTVARAS